MTQQVASFYPHTSIVALTPPVYTAAWCTSIVSSFLLGALLLSHAILRLEKCGAIAFSTPPLLSRTAPPSMRGHETLQLFCLRATLLSLPSLAGRSILYKQWAPLRRLVSVSGNEHRVLWRGEVPSFKASSGVGGMSGAVVKFGAVDVQYHWRSASPKSEYNVSLQLSTVCARWDA